MQIELDSMFDNYLDDVRNLTAINTADWHEYSISIETDTTHRLIKNAERNGATVLYPQPNELFLDIDTLDQYNQMFDRLPRLLELFGCQAAIKRDVPSNSGGEHRHVIIELSIQVDNATRAGLQMFLGSDPVRDVLALRRIMAGVYDPIIFIEGGEWKYE